MNVRVFVLAYLTAIACSGSVDQSHPVVMEPPPTDSKTDHDPSLRRSAPQKSIVDESVDTVQEIQKTASDNSMEKSQGTVLPEIQEMYEGCRDRVELPEQDDECTISSDCAIGGCGGEKCFPKRFELTLGSTCEHRQCFEILQSCECQKGRCQWTLKEGGVLKSEDDQKRPLFTE